jgi:hypothetical protein
MGRHAPLRSWIRAWACASAWVLLCAAASSGHAQTRSTSADAIEELDALVRAARFEEAIVRADGMRAQLGSGAADGELLRVRVEVTAATAYVALEREDAARDCFRRALAVEPALDLDPASTAPKVLRVDRSVRAEPRSVR